MTKSHCLHIFKCQYLIEILRYGANFLHVIITFIGFKITFSNIRSHGAPLLISRGWRLAPPPGFLTLRNTSGLIGLRLKYKLEEMCQNKYTLKFLLFFSSLHQHVTSLRVGYSWKVTKPKFLTLFMCFVANRESCFKPQEKNAA